MDKWFEDNKHAVKSVPINDEENRRLRKEWLEHMKSQTEKFKSVMAIGVIPGECTLTGGRTMEKLVEGIDYYLCDQADEPTIVEKK